MAYEDMTDMEIGYYIANIVKATHGRGDEDEFTKLMCVKREHLDKLSREYVLEEGKRIEHALITAAARLGWERLPTLAEIKRRFNETGDGTEEKNQAEKYGWILYIYSFMRNMNEEHQKAFMKALLYFHDDIEANWNIYRSVFECIRNQLQEVAHQCGHYLGDIKDQKEIPHHEESDLCTS